MVALRGERKNVLHPLMLLLLLFTVGVSEALRESAVVVLAPWTTPEKRVLMWC